MPLAINFASIKSTIATAEKAELVFGERGILQQLYSELLKCEESSQAAFRSEVDLENHHQAGISLYGLIYAQYTVLQEALSDFVVRIDDVLKAQRNRSAAFSNALTTCRYIASEYKSLIEAHLVTRKHFLNEQNTPSSLYRLCTLLGGKYYILSQADDPFIGGRIENGVTKESDGFCGGEVIDWCQQFINQGAPIYPIVGNHQIQHKQNEYNRIVADEVIGYGKKELGEVNFLHLLKQLDAKHVYYITSYEQSLGHAMGLKRFKNGHFHFFDPNVGVIFMPNGYQMAAWLSYHFAKLSRKGFCCDTLQLHQFRKAVAQPDAEPVPNDVSLWLVSTKDDQAKQAHEICEVVLRELLALVDDFREENISKIKVKKNFDAFQLLLTHHMQMNENIPIRELCRAVFRYFESGEIDFEMGVAAGLINKMDKLKVRELVPSLITYGTEKGRNLRKKILETPKRDRVVNEELKQFHRLLTNVIENIQFRVQIIDEKLATHEPENDAYLKMKKSVLLGFLAKVQSPLIWGLLQQMVYHPGHANDKADLQEIRMRLIRENPVFSKYPQMKASDYYLYIDDYVGDVLTDSVINNIKLIQTFANQLHDYAQKEQNDVVENNSFKEHLLNRVTVQVIAKIKSLDVEVQAVLSQIYSGKMNLNDGDRIVTNTIPLSVNMITGYAKNDIKIITLFLFKLYPNMNELLLPPFNSKLENLHQFFNEIDEMIKSYPFELMTYMKVMLTKLQNHFDAICLQASEKMDSQKYLHELSGLELSVVSLFGGLINTDVKLVDNAKEKLTLKMQPTSDLIKELKDAIKLMADYLEPFLAEQKLIAAIPKSAVKNLVFAKSLQDLYSLKRTVLNGLYQSTQMQLSQFIKHERTADQVRAFLRTQFTIDASGHIDVAETMKEAIEERKAAGKIVTETAIAALNTLHDEVSRLQRVIKAQKDIQSFQNTALKIDQTEISYLYNKFLLAQYQGYLNDLSDPKQPSVITILLKLPSSLICLQETSLSLSAQHVSQAQIELKEFIRTDPKLRQLRIEKCKYILTELSAACDVINKELMAQNRGVYIPALKGFHDYLKATLTQMSVDGPLYTDAVMDTLRLELNSRAGVELFSDQRELLKDFKQRISMNLKPSSTLANLMPFFNPVLALLRQVITPDTSTIKPRK